MGSALHYERMRSDKKYRLTGYAAVCAKIILGLSIVTFSLLILSSLNFEKAQKLTSFIPKFELPRWPRPSVSHLGIHHKASVAADNVYCSEIGRDVLMRGGNAVDAAIATIVCIGVMDPQSNGLGGGHFMTIYNATTRRCSVVDAREVAPFAANETMFVGRMQETQLGWKAIAVPGELHGLRTEYEHFGSGRVAWKDLLQPSLDLLRNGVPVSTDLVKCLRIKRDIIQNEPTMQVFVDPETGEFFKEGDLMKTRVNFLRTLRAIAYSDDPIKTFYDSNITQGMVNEFSMNGGLLTRDDFRAYRSVIRDDNQVIYTKLSRDRAICGPPPPSSSSIAMSVLKTLDGHEFDESTFHGNVDIYHQYIEASKFAYAHRSKMGDIAFEKEALDVAQQITSEEYIQKIRSKITDFAQDDSVYEAPNFAAREDHGTTHMAVLDQFGNAVSVTSTINTYFGAKVSSESSGVIWNCQMDDFSTPGTPNHYNYPPAPANFIRPGKKPQSSISPLVVFNEKSGEVKMVVGGAGGSKIISGVTSVALRTLFLGWNLKEAVDAPRIHNQLIPNVTAYERTFPPEYLHALSERGHKMVPDRRQTEVSTILRKHGHNYVNCDHRKGIESQGAGF